MAGSGAAADSNLKLYLLAGGFLFLLATGTLFLLVGTGGTHPAISFAHGAAANFQDREVDAFLERADFPLSVSIDRRPDIYTREAMAAAVEAAHNRLTYINIRPQEVTVRELDSGGEVEVEYHFHWTISGGVYANLRNRSEDRTEDSRPALAVLRLRPEGESWRVTEAHLETRR